MTRRLLGIVAVLFLLSFAVFAQANGKLQIHFMDAGQADSALLISPLGETVLFDHGVAADCDKPISYLEQLGIRQIDYTVVSHYDRDHIGCSGAIFREFSLMKDALDRGQSKSTQLFTKYVTAVGQHRKTASAGMVLTLDEGSPNPVQIKIVAFNGNGVPNANDENDKSIVAVIHFGAFDAELGGDLSGKNTGQYKDVETSVAPLVGQIEVYKVHHHCSQNSTNTKWLQTTKPRIAIISTGDGNTFHHPTQFCLDQLHAANVRTYWTEEGNGARPKSDEDVVGRNIIIEVAPGAQEFTVTYGDSSHDTYPMWESPAPVESKYAWSKAAAYYHDAHCRYVANISQENLERGNEPPDGKAPHKCVK